MGSNSEILNDSLSCLESKASNSSREEQKTIWEGRVWCFIKYYTPFALITLVVWIAKKAWSFLKSPTQQPDDQNTSNDEGVSGGSEPNFPRIRDKPWVYGGPNKVRQPEFARVLETSGDTSFQTSSREGSLSTSGEDEDDSSEGPVQEGKKEAFSSEKDEGTSERSELGFLQVSGESKSDDEHKVRQPEFARVLETSGDTSFQTSSEEDLLSTSGEDEDDSLSKNAQNVFILECQAGNEDKAIAYLGNYGRVDDNMIEQVFKTAPKNLVETLLESKYFGIFSFNEKIFCQICLNGRADIVKTLLKHWDVSVDVINRAGASIVKGQELTKNQIEIFRLLLDKKLGSSPRKEIQNACENIRTETLKSLLNGILSHKEAEKFIMEIIKAWLKKDEQVNQKRMDVFKLFIDGVSYYSFYFIQGCSGANAKRHVVEFFLNSGKISDTCCGLVTINQLRNKSINKEVLKLLLEKKDNSVHKEKETKYDEISRLISKHQEELAKILLSSGEHDWLLEKAKRLKNIALTNFLQFNKVIRNKSDFLNLCSTVSHTVIETYLKKGQIPDSIDKSEVFNWACTSNRVELVRVLLKAGVDPSVENSNAFTSACYAGDNSIVELLLADERINSSVGMEAVMNQIRNGRECFELIEAFVNSKRMSEEEVWEMIMEACRLGDEDVFSLLLTDEKVELSDCLELICCMKPKKGKGFFEALLSSQKATVSDMREWVKGYEDIKESKRDKFIQVINQLEKVDSGSESSQ